MTSFFYLIALAVSLAGVAAIDHRHRLAFFSGHRLRTVVAVGAGVAVFSVWDVVGIRYGVFFQGPGPYQSGLMVGPEFPIEELFFLTLLCYSSLVAYLAASRILEARRR
jgi:lycopene cyclase domain-containing protein